MIYQNTSLIMVSKGYNINFLLLLLFMFSFIRAQENTNCSSHFNEFMFVFSNSNSINDNGSIEEIKMTARLYIEGLPTTVVHINETKYSIPSNGFLTINIESNPVPNDISNKNIIKIKSDSDITVNAERISRFSSHNFPLIPVSLWGKEYIIPSYKDQSKAYKTSNFIDIMAVNKNTDITIKDNKGITLKKVSLKAGQNYEFNSTEDLSGYSVSANKNIGVISGNHCLRISAACDHTALMLPDKTQMGSLYYNPGTSFFPGNTLYRILANTDDTRIKIDGKLTALLKKGEFYEYTMENAHVIESSSPIMLYLLFNKRSLSSPEYSVDPSTILIPSVDNSLTTAHFTFPNFMIYSKDIQIIMKTEQTNALLLDGSAPKVQWKTFQYDTSISYATLSFDDTFTHQLSVSDPYVAFIPIFMARGLDVSLGTTKTGSYNLLTGRNPFCPQEKFVSINPKKENISSNAPIHEIFLTDINKPILVEKEIIDVFVFDNAEEDGDIVSLFLNDKLIYPDVQVLKKGTLLQVILEKGQNILTIKAENEGRIYPNTAGLTFDDGKTLQTIILHNKKGQSKSLKIISK